VCSLTFQPFPRSLLEKSVQLGGNSLGLDPTNGTLVNLLMMSYWRNKCDDAQIQGVMKKALEQIEEDSAARSQVVDYKYMNYAYSYQDPISSYGQKNKKKLQEVSKVYDPEGLFQKAVPSPFKLFP
jgi:hypothetical protein